MMENEMLRRIVVRQKNGLAKKEAAIPRDLLGEIIKWLPDKRVLVLTGVRRSGKSALLKQLMQKVKDYCYVNFEDERFIDFEAKHFEQLNEILIEVYGSSATYFFDEVQNIDHFEAFVRRLQDEGKKVIITGSNAALLSKEF